MRSTADLLGNYIRSAHPYRRSPQEQAVFFEGRSDRLALISAYSHGMGGRGMAEVRMAVVEEGVGGRALLSLEETTPVRVGEEETAPDRSIGWCCARAFENFAWLTWIRSSMKRDGKSAGTARNGACCRAPCA